MSNDNPDLPSRVESPCIGVCLLGADDICEGCFRTADEITNWRDYDNAQKRDVIRLGWERARAANRLL